MKNLVLIHGRSQQDKDPGQLKSTWISAWTAGLSKIGKTIPIDDKHIRFAYYGDMLRDATTGKDEGDIADIIVRSAEGADDESLVMLADILNDAVITNRISEDEIDRMMESIDGDGPAINEKGPQNWRWIHAILRLIDQHTPGGGLLIALVTNDTYQYLTNSRLRKQLEGGVYEAFDGDAENVVVAHSLGSIVVYTLFQRMLEENKTLKVPNLITVGSPLGVRAIRERLKRGQRPSWLGHWFNAMDPGDVVSLYPLDARNFPLDKRIENKTDVNNRTSNQHGISGYLDDPVVARRIYDALT